MPVERNRSAVGKTAKSLLPTASTTHAPPLRGPGPARPLPGTEAIRRAHFRLGHAGRQARTVSVCLNSAFSRHFYTFYGPSVQAMEIRLNALPILPSALGSFLAAGTPRFSDLNEGDNAPRPTLHVVPSQVGSDTDHPTPPVDRDRKRSASASPAWSR